MYPLDLDTPLWFTASMAVLAWLAFGGVLWMERQEARHHDKEKDQ